MPIGDFHLSDDQTIVAVNPGHDGAFVALRNGCLELCYPAEGNSMPRYLPANAYFLLNCLTSITSVPDVIATSGWTHGWPYQSAHAPYYGIGEECTRTRSIEFCGHRAHLFESTHERSHIFCTYGLSPFPQGDPCYVLVWEGEIGSFYEIDEKLQIVQHGPVLPHPGYKYTFLFDLADPKRTGGRWNHEAAGKLMALAGFSQRTQGTSQELRVVRQILSSVAPHKADKADFSYSSYYNCGVTAPHFRELVRVFSDALFDVFYSYAKANLKLRYPLLIAGGCGLNCEWNSKWRDCGLFAEVFVPPVTNDSGSAIGTAIDAQFVHSGNAKVAWNVYIGPEFVFDGYSSNFKEIPFNLGEIAFALESGCMVAWVQGRSEIGPRALGNRSILAEPFHMRTKERLNDIKKREWYRPIAPVCLEEDADLLFGLKSNSPFMLYFARVRVSGIDAITHVDGSARVQTVNEDQNPLLYLLLKAFKQRTGVGVLCNTSLNRKGKGFFSRSSDLFEFAGEQHIDLVVINDRAYASVELSSYEALHVQENGSLPLE